MQHYFLNCVQPLLVPPYITIFHCLLCLSCQVHCSCPGRCKLLVDRVQSAPGAPARPPRHRMGSYTCCSLTQEAPSSRLYGVCGGTVRAQHSMPCTQLCTPMQPSPTPQNPPALRPPQLQLGARCAAHAAAQMHRFAAQWGVVWGDVAHLLWSPRSSPLASPAAPSTPHDRCPRRTCRSRRNGYAGRTAGQLQTWSCAARPCARGRQRRPRVAQAAPKMGAGVGECGCKRWRRGVQPLPPTREDPVPAWGRFFPQFRRENARACAQQHCERHVRHG